MSEITSEHLFCVECRNCKRTCCGTLIYEVSTIVAIDGSGFDIHTCPNVISVMGAAARNRMSRARVVLWTYRSCALRLLGALSRVRPASTQ